MMSAALTTILYWDLKQLRAQREYVDGLIIKWLDNAKVETFNDLLAYRDMAGHANEKPLDSLLTHLFLHQVHHRGQVTVLLSQFGIDFGETDLLEII